MAAEVTPLHAVPSDPADEGDPADEALAAVATQVHEHLDDLVPSMGEAYRREVAEYAAMDDEAFALVLRTSRGFVERFVDAVASGVVQPVPERAALLASGRRRQAAGISLDAAMHAFRIASRVGWTAIADAATAVAPQLVSELAGRWIEYADRASTAFAEGHTSATSEQLRRLDARRHALLADLLAAEDETAARAVAAGHGLRLASRYVPVLLDGASVAAEDALGPHLPEGALLGRRGQHLLVLVPDELPEDLPGRIVGDGTLAHGRAVVPGTAMRAELAEVEAVLATAVSLGEPGVRGPGDLVVHRAVREHQPLAEHLRSVVLEPLAGEDPDGIFLETLTAYLEDGSVRAVADRLFVHANTVNYRLRRVRELTGLDPRVPVHAARLVLATALAAQTHDAPSAQEDRP